MKFQAVDFDIVKSFGVFVMLGIIIGTIFAAKLKNSLPNSLFFNYNNAFCFLFFDLERKRLNPVQNKMNMTHKIILGSLSGFFAAPYGNRRRLN